MSNNLEALKNGELICRNSQFCKVMDVGIHNRLFGGVMMAELDSACAVFAAEIHKEAGRNPLTIRPPRETFRPLLFQAWQRFYPSPIP